MSTTLISQLDPVGTLLPAALVEIEQGGVSYKATIQEILDLAGSTSLPDGDIFVGNASNVATAVTMSGDATIINTGALTISNDAITTTKILNGAVTNDKLATDAVTNIKVDSGAAIEFSKLESLSSANIIVGSGGNVATAVAVTGDISISNTGVTAIGAGVIVNADINASAAIDATKIHDGSVDNTEFGYLNGVTSAIQTQLDSKLTTSLTEENIFVGNASNIATGVAITGDISITSTGVVSISAGVIVDADINASAAINATKIHDGSVDNTEFGYLNGVTSSIQTQLDSKLTTTLTDTNIFVGNGSNVATGVAMSGDATLANTGALTIANNAITTVKIQDDNVTYAKIQNVVANNVILGNISGAGGIIEELDGADVTALLNVFTTTLQGVVPGSGGGTTNFLRADGTWAVPAGGGDVTGPASSTDNAIVRFDSTTGKIIQNSGVIVDDSNNITGLGTLNTHTIPGGTSTFAIISNNLSVFAATTSAQLASVISDETGSGLLVFGTSPTIVTPTIASFTNATHDHADAAGGGQLTNTALTSGVFSAITGIGAQTQALDMNGNNIESAELPTDTVNFVDATDETKKLAFGLASITTANTRTLTMPDANVNLGALTNSNLSSGVFGAITGMGVQSQTLDIGGNDIDNIQNTILDLSTSGTDVDFSEDMLQEISISANTTFTGTNYAIGKSKILKIDTDGTTRTLTFPANWVFLGSKPTEQEANKTGILSLTCFTAAEAGVVAVYAVEA